MDTELVGRVVRLGRGWVEVDTGASIRRVTSPPGLVLHVGNYVELRGDIAVRLSKSSTQLLVSTRLPPQPSQLQQ
jgi:hypothetical protein